MLSLLLGAALALERATHPVTLVGGSALAYGAPDSYGATTDGRLLIRLGRAQVDLAAREGWALNDARLIGALFFGGRWSWASGVYLRAGLAHNHEVPQEIVAAEPVGSLLGAAEGIRHRTGAAAGAGWLTSPLADGFTQGRVRFGVDLDLAAFPDSQGPYVYTGLAGQVLIGVGPAE